MEVAAMIEKTAQIMSQYAGRDKSLRSLYFALLVYSTKLRREKAALLVAFAKQMSQTRLVLRQFNHFAMIQACRSAYNAYLNGPEDRVEHALISGITGIYSVYGVVELLAWLADAKLVALDAGNLFKCCLYMWIAALICGIIKTARQILKKGIQKSRDDQLTLVALGSDFVSAINSLPFQFLWAGKLSLRTSATFSLIASVIGLYKLY
uniref:Peroxisomal biogenesis factor 11 n=1 Tax=Steinernema glaseri TaxID=37863 RepID=A0A1I7Z5D6_9BILA